MIFKTRSNTFIEESALKQLLIGEEEDSRPRKGPSSIGLTAAVLLLSALINVLLLSYNFRLRYALDQKGRSNYVFAGPELSELIPYHTLTEYSSNNRTEVDALWEALNTTPGAISLSYDFVEEKGLLRPVTFPWDDDRGIFFVKSFHILHCIKLIKWRIDEFRNGMKQNQPNHHINHCLDTILQDIKCHADDTPFPMMDNGHPTGDGQMVQCRSWDKLVEWTTSPENTACYKQDDEITDDRPSLENYRSCPKNSPYYDVMTAYFEK